MRLGQEHTQRAGNVVSSGAYVSHNTLLNIHSNVQTDAYRFSCRQGRKCLWRAEPRLSRTTVSAVLDVDEKPQPERLFEHEHEHSSSCAWKRNC